MPNNTILIAAGGTGGHLYPTIAVAEEIRRLRPDVRVIFIGTRDRIESREVPRAGYPFFPIAIDVPRKSVGSMISFSIKMVRAILDSVQVIARERPTAMLGGGAYLTIPTGIAAWLRGVPMALLEINSVAGTANKLLARIAAKLFIAYPESQSQFPLRVSSSATVSGTPVRADLGSVTMSQADARKSFDLDPACPTILVFGGSLGARAINEAMEASAATLAEQGFNILWQTGKGVDLDTLRAKFSDKPNVRVMDYIYDMERAYHAADLVVCRAGASSLAELARLGKPAVLVPWSKAAANHQEPNARAFERDHAAVVLTDSEVQVALLSTIQTLLADGERLRLMSAAMLRRDNPEAATVVAQWLIDRIS